MLPSVGRAGGGGFSDHCFLMCKQSGLHVGAILGCAVRGMCGLWQHEPGPPGYGAVFWGLEVCRAGQATAAQVAAGW